MAAVLTEPEAAKAATLTPGPGMVHMSFPITKREDTGDINPVDGTPDIEIWGKATDGTLDSDLQIVDPDWSLAALKTSFSTKGNVRMSHDPKQPVGKGVDIDGHYVRARIADPKAKHFIRQGILNDFSVGIMNPDVRKGDPRFRHLDPQGKAVNGIITGRPDGLSGFGEISVVDRGANYGSSFALVKAAADGTPEWVGEMTAEPAAVDSGLTTVDLPSDMKLKVTPAVLAKMATLKRDLVLREQELKTGATSIIKAAEPGPEADPSYHAMKAAEAVVYKRDIDTATRRRLASEGHALPNLSYPIETAGDLENAATLARSGHGDVAAATRLIGRRAKDLGVPNPMKKKPGKAKKAAAAGVTKCGTCGGNGEMDGKPCPDCKGKTAAPSAEKKKGKLRAICPNCGAKQNPEHNNCPECGHMLPARPPMVAKNHDFACLGCGRDLDKGEKFCPGCGKENPGHNPMADLKIPANKEAAKAAGKDRVAKAKKKSGKKGKPFGGNQAMPFGKEKDEPDEKEAAKSAAVIKRKGKGKGRSPAAGVKGHETMGLPPHREPDGAPVEQFENDAALQDGDQQMKAAMRHKSLGIDPQLAVLHDLTCPAFAPADVTRAFPAATFAGISTGYWQKAALDAASGPDPAAALARYNEMAGLSKAAVILKTADAQVMHQIRLASHEAFLEANKDTIKTFHDATPGPGSAPTPGHVMPGSFRRPYISAGHAAASPQADPARSFPVITGHPHAEDFTRGYISAGHASESPDNSHGGSPVSQGAPGGVHSVASDAAGMQARDYESARSTMHDHLSRIAPGMCAMSPEAGTGQKPAPQVPEAVGGPEPHKGKATKAQKAARKAKIAKQRARKLARAEAARRRKVQAQVLKGKISVDDARAALGLAPFGLPETAQKAALSDVTDPVAAQPAALDADAITAAVKAATAPLARRVKAQDRALRKSQKVLNAIAGQPDTSQAPFRGAGVYKASVAPAAPLTLAESAAQAQTGNLLRLQKQYKESYNPVEREAARKELIAQLGIDPMTGTPDNTHPFRT